VHPSILSLTPTLAGVLCTHNTGIQVLFQPCFTLVTKPD